MKFLKLAGVNVLVLVGILLVLEAVAQIIAIARPTYDVLYMQPDKAVGWKPVPQLRFTWGGWDWYAAEFSVEVALNQYGFRDLGRSEAKPPGVTRVAVLGDSFIEALQVPLDRSATQLLEQRLNEPARRTTPGPTSWEVLNFGVSNHGVGQYLLMWEAYASKFQPDYVVIFVAKFHMRRSVSKYEYRAFTATRNERLWVRPTFRMENGLLTREPARDFDKFVEVQEGVIKSEFGGERIRSKPKQMITLHYARFIWDELGNWIKRGGADQRRTSRIPPGSEGELVALNVRIIEELGRSVASAGARLVVVDASQYFEQDPSVSLELEERCARQGFGYVPVYKELMQANANGTATRWINDTHFNEAGNQILAAALYRWIAQNGRAHKSH